MTMSNGGITKRFIKKLASREGFQWICPYCGCQLIPPGSPIRQPYYTPEWIDIDLCDPHRPWRSELRLFWPISKGYDWAVVDHVVPTSKGGLSKLENLTVCCTKCNRLKGNKSVEEFLNWKIAHDK